MLVVSNTSPISNLAIIDRLELLRYRYGKVWIPPAVAVELKSLTHLDAQRRIEFALTNGWLGINQNPGPELRLALDAGEAEAIRIAVNLKANVLLLDERKARVEARKLGLRVGGVLGELLYAKRVGVLSLIEPEIQKLRVEARFFIDAEIERFILSEAGE